MALEDITSRILGKAGAEAEAILAQARERASRRKEETSQRIAHEVALATRAAQEEAKAHYERLVASAHLEARKRELEAKRALIDEAVDAALASIPTQGEERYLAFLQKLLLEAPLTGVVEVLVAPKDRALLERRLGSLQQALRDAGRDLTLRLADDARDIDGGLILRQGRIEYNASLAAMKRFRQQVLREGATRALFGDGV